MIRKLLLCTIVVSLFFFTVKAQSGGQVIKGNVTDAVTQVPLPGATVVIQNSNPQKGTITDENGDFRLWDIKPGRYNIAVSFIGYENYLFREIMVGSGKEVVLNAGLKESTEQLNEVKVVARTSKEKPINAMATISARQLSVEEANRYAGGYDDPARLASSFAGVASEIGNNGIIIRGNSPRGLLWRMEGVEISNPTHFANVTAFGAGGITALSSQMLANSDFFTGAFPAEYGNALSGVFDVKMRTGNKDKYEHTFQLGGIGTDFSSEGPILKGSDASYLFNYRYSTYSLLGPLIPEEAGKINYQDFSFKLNFPTKNAGTFSLWGIGALDAQKRNAISDPADWEKESDKESYKLKLSMGAVGLSHKMLLSSKTYLHTTIAASGNGIETTSKELDNNMDLQNKEQVTNNTWKYTLTCTLNHKFGPAHSNRTGFIWDRRYFNVDNRETRTLGDPLFSYAADKGNTSTCQAFSQSNIKLNNKVDLNAGLHTYYFGLTGEFTIEPRIGMKYLLSHNQSIGLAYGLNSRLEMIGFYLARQETPTGIVQPNRNLKLTKAHHFGLAYDVNINEKTRFKVEPYFQYLFDVPVVPGSYFSLQNLELDWFFNDTLVNKGTGTNLGVDFTLEHFLNKGFYYLITASVFDSKYKGGDGIKRNSLYNKNFMLNVLAGKEWTLGKNKSNLLGLNTRLSILGGDRYIPVLEQESIASGEIMDDYDHAYEPRETVAQVLSFSISYRKNKPKHASIWSLHLLNALGQKEFRGYEFNLKTGALEKQYDLIVVPNISYKIEF